MQTENYKNFCPTIQAGVVELVSVGSFFGYDPCLFGRAEILVILGLHFGRNNNLINSLKLTDLYDLNSNFPPKLHIFFSLSFSYMIFSSLVKSLAWYHIVLEFSQFICNLHLFAFSLNCQVVRLKPRDTIKNATLLAAKCGQNYLLIFYVFKIYAVCNRCFRTPNFWLEIMVIIEFESHLCNYKISD